MLLKYIKGINCTCSFGMDACEAHHSVAAPVRHAQHNTHPAPIELPQTTQTGTILPHSVRLHRSVQAHAHACTRTQPAPQQHSSISTDGRSWRRVWGGAGYSRRGSKHLSVAAEQLKEQRCAQRPRGAHSAAPCMVDAWCRTQTSVELDRSSYATYVRCATYGTRSTAPPLLRV